jgi:serine/threonine-protein kinase
MERLILKTLSKSPDDRPQTAESFKAELIAVGKEARRANHASRRGVSSSVLAPIPSKGAQAAEWKDRTDTGASPWGPHEQTVRSSPPPALAAKAPMAPLATATVNAPPPSMRTVTGGAPIEAPSMLPFKIITLLLATIAVGLGGYYLYQLYFSSYEAEPIPQNAPVPLNSQGSSAPGTGIEPLYLRQTPHEQWKSDEAEKLAREATLQFERGDWGLAASKLKDAYERAQKPEYALKLGAILRMRGTDGEREARGWWKRFLTDAPESPARAQIVAVYPDLVSPAAQ